MLTVIPDDAISSAKVPKRLKDKLERIRINVSDATEKGLEYALREKKVEELEKMLEGVNLQGFLTNKS